MCHRWHDFDSRSAAPESVSRFRVVALEHAAPANRRVDQACQLIWRGTPRIAQMKMVVEPHFATSSLVCEVLHRGTGIAPSKTILLGGKFSATARLRRSGAGLKRFPIP
jgi:hypothetical protein